MSHDLTRSPHCHVTWLTCHMIHVTWSDSESPLTCHGHMIDMSHDTCHMIWLWVSIDLPIDSPHSRYLTPARDEYKVRLEAGGYIHVTVTTSEPGPHTSTLSYTSAWWMYTGSQTWGYIHVTASESPLTPTLSLTLSQAYTNVKSEPTLHSSGRLQVKNLRHTVTLKLPGALPLRGRQVGRAPPDSRLTESLIQMDSTWSVDGRVGTP